MSTIVAFNTSDTYLALRNMGFLHHILKAHIFVPGAGIETKTPNTSKHIKGSKECFY